MPEDIKVSPEAFTADIIRRLGLLEEGHKELIASHHSLDKQLIAFQTDLKHIRTGQDDMKGGMNKLLWGIGLVFITYIVGFIVAGGLNVTGVQ